jgi:hypothetical protein
MSKKAFTLIEALTASFIALLIVIAAWGVYVMSWSWWHDINPDVEAQRIARVALNRIITGTADSTTGSYTIGGTTYKRRNGIAQATSAPTITSPQSISFRLEPDTYNIRSYYLGVDPASGLNVVYYRDGSNTVHKIDATVGITDLLFEQYQGANNMIRITATVSRDIVGTGTSPRHISVSYSDLAYLRNVGG